MLFRSDALTYTTNSIPLHGVNQNFNPNGTVTYLPTRGFRGLDRFTYYATDGFATSSVVTLNLNVVSPADINANGLPDGWEAAYNLTDPNADPDGDGRTNAEEYLANTNPTNAASVFRITGAARQANGHVVLSWPSVGGTRYRVQYANAAAPAGGFTDLVRPLATEMDSGPYGAPATKSFTDDFTLTGPPTNGARYYRIKLTQ